ncbi:MAG: DUF192 domain-containing protein [Sinobacteraceae bacterium]|nr:DUF192 domain-containing protein [Nevskiaceae bacterium]MCP5471983.1 DUF192 domain-containing protein [Nevskiaceae bacterium]
MRSLPIPRKYTAKSEHRLAVESRATGIPVRRAESFLTRAIGLLDASPGAPAVALELRPCAAVHTFGMRRAIDVVFVDAAGCIRRVVGDLAPWRLAWCRGAAAVWELPAGMAHRLGLRPGLRLGVVTGATSVVERMDPSSAGPAAGVASGFCGRRRCRSHGKETVPVVLSPCRTAGRRPARQRPRSAAGVALVEFLLAGLLVLLPLTFATLELAQLMVARHALDYATFEAARAGAVSGASETQMRLALARALVPLLAPVDVIAVLGGRDSDGDLAVGSRALIRATTEVLRPDLTRLWIENPTARAAADFAEIDDSGRRVIPNDGLEVRNPLGARSGQTLREANVLAIRVRYCRVLVMPLIRDLLPAMLRTALPQPFNQLCLAQGRLPIDARAVVHMQSPVEVAGLPPG